MNEFEKAARELQSDLACRSARIKLTRTSKAKLEAINANWQAYCDQPTGSFSIYGLLGRIACMLWKLGRVWFVVFWTISIRDTCDLAILEAATKRVEGIAA